MASEPEPVAWLCGDAKNGGLLRDLAYTVWVLCHNPTHEDGNTDWGSDTLPAVNVQVEKAREILAAALLAAEQRGRGSGSGWRDLPRAEAAIKRLREIWQAGSEKLPGYQTDQEIYGAMHTQVLELLSCDPAATCEAQLRETKARLGRRSHTQGRRDVRTLHLALKREYFDAIRDGTKAEEFRLATPYWVKRLEAREYDIVVLTKGYPKAGDPDRTLIRKWRGAYGTTITHPHFGPEPVDVYAIDVSTAP